MLDSVNISMIFMAPRTITPAQKHPCSPVQALLLRIVVKKAVANDQPFDVGTHRNSKGHSLAAIVVVPKIRVFIAHRFPGRAQSKARP